MAYFTNSVAEFCHALVNPFGIELYEAKVINVLHSPNASPGLASHSEGIWGKEEKKRDFLQLTCPVNKIDDALCTNM